MNDGRKRKPQKHQNRSGFKIAFDPQSEQVHKKVSYRGLCKRCTDQLQWKIKYNKYKKMTEPARCHFCVQKTVFRSYMRACDICMDKNNVCPKCLEEESKQKVEMKLNQVEQKKKDEETEKRMNQFLKTLKERSRRTVRRLVEKGSIDWSNELGNYVDKQGNLLPLHFRHGCDGKSDMSDDGNDIDHDEDFDEEDEDENGSEEEEVIKKKKKEIKNQSDKKSKIENKAESVEEKEVAEQKDEKAGEQNKVNEQQWSDVDSDTEETTPKQEAQQIKKQKA